MQEEPWYNPIVVFLTGMSVPLGSSERMYQEVQVPHEEAVRGLEAFQNEIVAVATGTSSGASGAWPEEYVRAMATFASGDGADYVQGLKDTAGQLADGAHEFGYQIDYTNAMIVGQVVVFLAEWALTLVLAYFNPVQALVEQLALERVFGQFFKLALVRFAINAGLIMSVSVGLAAALDGLTRWVLAQHGETTTQGSQYRKQSLEFGAIQGAFGAFLPFVMEPAAKVFSRFFGPAVSKSIREAIDAAAGPGHVLARTLGKDLGGDLEKVLARDLGTDVGGDLGKDVGGGAGKRFESGVAREADEKPGPPPLAVFSRRFADEVTGMAGALHAGVVDVQARRVFTRGMGELFAWAFGEEGRAAGESWALAFARALGRSGLEKALRGALEELPAQVAGERLRVALSRGVVRGLDAQWQEKFARMLAVEAPINAGHQNVSEGVFNWMTMGKFTTSFATGISGAGGGVISAVLHIHAVHLANMLKENWFGTPPSLDIDPSLFNSDKPVAGTGNTADTGPHAGPYQPRPDDAEKWTDSTDALVSPDAEVRVPGGTPGTDGWTHNLSRGQAGTLPPAAAAPSPVGSTLPTASSGPATGPAAQANTEVPWTAPDGTPAPDPTGNWGALPQNPIATASANDVNSPSTAPRSYQTAPSTASQSTANGPSPDRTRAAGPAMQAEREREREAWRHLFEAPADQRQAAIDELTVQRGGIPPTPAEIELRQTVGEQLGRLPGVTITVDDAAGPGHQTAAAMFINSLDDLGYPGRITVVASDTVRDQLAGLIPDHIKASVDWQPPATRSDARPQGGREDVTTRVDGDSLLPAGDTDRTAGDGTVRQELHNTETARSALAALRPTHDDGLLLPQDVLQRVAGTLRQDELDSILGTSPSARQTTDRHSDAPSQDGSRQRARATTTGTDPHTLASVTPEERVPDGATTITPEQLDRLRTTLETHCNEQLARLRSADPATVTPRQAALVAEALRPSLRPDTALHATFGASRTPGTTPTLPTVSPTSTHPDPATTPASGHDADMVAAVLTRHPTPTPAPVSARTRGFHDAGSGSTPPTPPLTAGRARSYSDAELLTAVNKQLRAITGGAKQTDAEHIQELQQSLTRQEPLHARAERITTAPTDGRAQAGSSTGPGTAADSGTDSGQNITEQLADHIRQQPRTLNDIKNWLHDLDDARRAIPANPDLVAKLEEAAKRRQGVALPGTDGEITRPQKTSDLQQPPWSAAGVGQKPSAGIAAVHGPGERTGQQTPERPGNTAARAVSAPGRLLDRVGLNQVVNDVIRKTRATSLSAPRSDSPSTRTQPLQDCLALLHGFIQEVHQGELHGIVDGPAPSGIRPLTSVDDIVVGRGHPEDALAPGAHWNRIPSWKALTEAVQNANPGATALVLIDRRDGTGHALAVHHTTQGVTWVELQAHENGPAAPRTPATDNDDPSRETGIPPGDDPWQDTGRPPRSDVVDARAVIVEHGGHVLTDSLPWTSEAASTVRALTDPPASHGYGVDYKLIHPTDTANIVESDPKIPLWHFSVEPPEVVFKRGFQARNPENIVTVAKWAAAWTSSQFVSTTTYEELNFKDRRFRYKVDPQRNSDPTGVDVNATRDRTGERMSFFREKEVAFTRAIEPEAIVGVYDYWFDLYGTWNARHGVTEWNDGIHKSVEFYPPSISKIREVVRVRVRVRDKHTGRTGTWDFLDYGERKITWDDQKF